MFAMCSFVGFIWFAPFITSLFHLMKEIDILCLSLKDMDYWLKDKIDSNYEFHLKQYFKGVIEHHQNICRTVQELNEALSVFLFLFNCVCCAQICVSLYSCFEMSDSVSQMKYILLLGPVFSCFYFFCWSGQELINKNDQLERVIADCNWMNKPKWFRSSLRIMILRSSKPLQIKPFGLYTLNFNNIMMVCRAAYSFFNFMHKVQMKSIS
ncbi:odorant receptor 67c-like [Nilaparvata lugens]|uniref:odorant receptor 67c-like n=1 Tax=Nilaparvata lugens TaxID=108931 RepID=UPI00193DCAFC|nr:odorant receptor 67c-like [Nilaparvata lugens]